MAWDGVAYFFGGAFAANFVPHLVAGVSGRPFPTPFAKPPFRGLSSPSVNVLWALANLVAAYTLFEVVGSLDLHRVADASPTAMGFGLWSLNVARAVTKLRAPSS